MPADESSTTAAEPTDIRHLALSIGTLSSEVRELIQQFQQLHRQRDFELHQRYGKQAFLDFEHHRPPQSS